MVLGITGGISTGKSTAIEAISPSGVRIIDCDEISHYLAGYNSQVLTAIREQFGDSVFKKLGALNRAALAKVVFASSSKREALESILHPLIIKTVRENIKYAATTSDVLVVVAPLLIEAGMNKDVDHTWVISCSPEAQLKRLCRRTGLSATQARKWIKAQMPLKQKERYADTVIYNNGSIDEFKRNVRCKWNEFIRLKS